MFRSKDDVDKHRQESFAKLKSEKEKALRSLSIAQLYYKVNDFESAKHFVSSYLSIKHDSSIGHKLLAQCFEALDEKQKALDEYKYSLQLDPKQDELVLKVCKLLIDVNIIADKIEARYWLDKGEILFPYDTTIYKLKRKVAALCDDDNLVIGKNFQMGSAEHSLELNIKSETIKEIYDKTFSKKKISLLTREHLEHAIQICEVYKNKFPSSIGEEFYANYLFSVERMLALYAQDVDVLNSRSIPECISLLAKFDGLLATVVSLKCWSESLCAILNHLSGQLCFHTASILFRKLKWEEKNIEDLNRLASALLLLSTAEHFKISNCNLQNEPLKQIFIDCSLLCTYRIYQAGLLLLSLSKNSDENFLESVHRCYGINWRECVLEKVYSTSEFKKFCVNAFFKTNDLFSKIPHKLPENLLGEFNQIVSTIEIIHPGSLHHLVWLGVQYLRIVGNKSVNNISLTPQFRTTRFLLLPFSQSNMSSNCVDSLCVLDVDVFLYACIYIKWASVQTDSVDALTFQNFPADVSRMLNYSELDSWAQCCEWWRYAYQTANKIVPHESWRLVRDVLQRGIEALRSIENNSLPLPLLVLLGRTLRDRGASESHIESAIALEARASYYWKAAVPLLDKVARGEVDNSLGNTMFDYMKLLILPSDAAKLLEEAKCNIGIRSGKNINLSSDKGLMTPVSPTKHVSSSQDSLMKKLLQTVIDQDSKISKIMDTNTKMVDRLEILFNKQERLACTELHLSHVVASLSKKLDDIVLTNKSYAESLPKVVPGIQGNQPTITYSSTFAGNFNSNTSNYRHNTEGNLTTYEFDPISTPLTSLPQYISPSCSNITTMQNVRIPSFPPPLLPAKSSQHNVFSDMDLKSILTFAPNGKNSQITENSTLTSSDTTIWTPSSTKLTSEILTTPVKSHSVQCAPHLFQIPVPDVTFTVIPSPVEVPAECEESDEERNVEHDPIPDFKPIIPLPDEIVVTTGEEDEERLFESRVKLFRFVEKEWKERGLGTLKILKNVNTGRVRVLMRREIVHKICANHLLSPNMILTRLASSDRAWVYSAPDFAEEKMMIEKFCVKFKTPDIAEDFRKMFDQYKCTNENISLKNASASCTSSVRTSVTLPVSLPVETDTQLEKKDNFSGLVFSSKPVINHQQMSRNEDVEGNTKAPFSSFTFNWSHTSQAPYPASKIFPSTPSSETHLSVDSSPMPFSAMNNAVDFSSLSKNAANTRAFTKSETFKGFAGAGSLVFGSMPTNVETSASSAVSAILKGIESNDSKSSNTSTNSPQRNDSKCENTHDDFEPTVEFQPVVPLPKLVEVKTGEEGMQVLFDEQCKLFRFVNNEWKERGVGNMKILRDPKDLSVRLLMRRDQVHKVCCNQRLFDGVELQPLKTNNKAWTWSNQDFSEGELKNELLCVRFKSESQGNAFKEAFNEAVQSLRSLQCSAAPSVTTSLSSLSEQFKRVSNTWEYEHMLAERSACSTSKDAGEEKTDMKTWSPPSLSQMFKPKAGSWVCQACYVTNSEDATICVACATPKNGTSFSSTDLSSHSVIFGSEAIELGTNSGQEYSTPFKFGVSEAAVPAHPPVTSSVFRFGENLTTSCAVTTAAPAVTTVADADPMTAFGFVAPTTVNATTTTTTNITGITATNSTIFSFGSGNSLFSSSLTQNSNFVFSFGSSHKEQKGVSGGFIFDSPLMGEARSDKGDISKSAITFGDSITKNESKFNVDSTSAFSSFSFKLDNNRVSNISPLKFNSSSANASASGDNSEKINVADLSQRNSPSSDEVEFVSEVPISADDKRLAESLMLPTNYFAYKYVGKGCPGCIGCDPEDPQLEDSEKTETNVSLPNVLTPKLQYNSLGNDNSTGLNFVFGGVNRSAMDNKKQTSPFIVNENSCVTTPSSVEVENALSSDDEKVLPLENDPHFKPVISLPDIVQTRTGEEEETVLFKQRAKLYRYDHDRKEWRERGVGELKILHHPEDKTYRLLLRRDQVHKIVLNQRITPSLSLEPLASSKNSWCWFGMNLPEESSQSIIENLAVRFKNEEITNDFYNKVNECISELNCSKVDDEDAAKNSRLNECSSVEGNDNDERRILPAVGEDLSRVEYNESQVNVEYDVDERDYVDEQGIEDAMQEYSSDNQIEIMLEEAATLHVCDNTTSTEYNGIVKLFKSYCTTQQSDISTSVLDFSTYDVPSLYNVEIAPSTFASIEGDTVAFTNKVDVDLAEIVKIRFTNEFSASKFFTTFEMMKSMITVDRSTQ